jgi:hypothetical protein
MLQSSAQIDRILPATEKIIFLASFLCLLTRAAALVRRGKFNLNESLGLSNVKFFWFYKIV